MPNIIYLGSIDGFHSAKEVLQKIGDVFHVEPTPHAVEIALVKADALLDASMKVPITESMLDIATKLKIISCATTGSNHISQISLEERNIKIHTLKEDKELLMDLTPAAELSWALLMALARKLNSAFDDVKKGNWIRENFPGVMLKGKTIGIVGCGRIGGWMAKYAGAFGMNVIGFDPFISNFPDNIKKVELQHLFETSDFITIHVHLTAETAGMVNMELLSKCKPNAILINTSRGQLIKEEDLLCALKNNQIGGVGLDVLADEPEINKSILFQYAKENDNLIITPHCGGFSPDAVRIVCERAGEKIKNYFLNT